MEVKPADLPTEGSGPFVISMLESRVAVAIDQMREVFRAHPGATEVHVRLQSGKHTRVIKLGDKHRVKPSPSLVADLKQLLGAACVG